MRLPPALVIVACAVIVHLPELTGFFIADPMSRHAGVVTGGVRGAYPGVPELDPNSGFNAQALGRRAAIDWVSGEIPWWNPYEGVGVPLAGEMQCAAFFPLTLLHLLPNGHLLVVLALQIVAGLGAYLLLRSLAASPLAAMTGGILFEFNGTLAWFTHAAANPVPFLPFLLLGVEHSARESVDGQGQRGAVVIAVSLCLSLLAGFPETAYIDGLLAALWTALRFGQSPRKIAFLSRVMVGVVLGLMLAAPLLVAFFEYLREADVGAHANGQFADLALPARTSLQLLLPYVFGNPVEYNGRNPVLDATWASTGGYLGAIVLFAAIAGSAGKRHRALKIVLAAWALVALGKTYGVPGVVQLCNLLPFVKDVAWFRYADPSWELAAALLAAFSLDELDAERARLRFAAAAVAGLSVVLFIPAIPVLRDLKGEPLFTRWVVFSVGWPLAGLIVVMAATRTRRRVLAMVLCVDAAVLSVIPRFSEPRKSEYGGLAGVGFLQENLGLARFFSLGPIAPNYGSFFGIASVNHNDLPIPTRWMRFVTAHLNPYVATPLFIGDHYYDRSLPSPESELVRNRDWYEAIGVKYVVADRNSRLDVGRVVHRDAAMTIFELPNPKPYFEVASGKCRLNAASRTDLTADCEGSGELVRRELFFPGWSATSNGAPIAIAEAGGLFQRVPLSAGINRISFRYAPVHGRPAAWGSVLALVCAVILGGPLNRWRWWKRQ